jgi:hypothetical protein
MVYDAARGVVMLFGGVPVSPSFEDEGCPFPAWLVAFVLVQGDYAIQSRRRCSDWYSSSPNAA